MARFGKCTHSSQRNRNSTRLLVTIVLVSIGVIEYSFYGKGSTPSKEQNSLTEINTSQRQRSQRVNEVETEKCICKRVGVYSRFRTVMSCQSRAPSSRHAGRRIGRVETVEGRSVRRSGDEGVRTTMIFVIFWVQFISRERVFTG